MLGAAAGLTQLATSNGWFGLANQNVWPAVLQFVIVAWVVYAVVAITWSSVRYISRYRRSRERKRHS
jgi:hypothetical protein